MMNQWATSMTLLEQAQRNEHGFAWEQFVERYEKFIFHLLHKMQVESSDIDDLTQIILMKIWRNLEKYDKSKGKFRTWLSVLIKNCVINFFKSSQNKRSKEKSMTLNPESYEEFTEASQNEIDDLIEEEWKVYVTNLAFDHIKPYFSKNAISAFSQSLDGIDNQTIADNLGIKQKSVIELNARVRSRYLKEVKRLIVEIEA